MISWDGPSRVLRRMWVADSSFLLFIQCPGLKNRICTVGGLNSIKITLILLMLVWFSNHIWWAQILMPYYMPSEISEKPIQHLEHWMLLTFMILLFPQLTTWWYEIKFSDFLGVSSSCLSSACALWPGQSCINVSPCQAGQQSDSEGRSGYREEVGSFGSRWSHTGSFYSWHSQCLGRNQWHEFCS